MLSGASVSPELDLSAGDLKLQLYDHLKSSGALTALKVQPFTGQWGPAQTTNLTAFRFLQSKLRSQVLCRLQNGSGAETQRLSQQPASLWTRAFESLLLDYLDVYAYGYSASVFRAEAGLGPSAPLFPSDVKRILGLKTNGSLQKAIEQSGGTGKTPSPFLICMPPALKHLDHYGAIS